MSKIVFYVNAINGGGAERVMVNLAKYFSENGYDTTLVTSFRDTWEYPLAATVRRLTLEEEEIKQSRIKRNFSREIYANLRSPTYLFLLWKSRIFVQY